MPAKQIVPKTFGLDQFVLAAVAGAAAGNVAVTGIKKGDTVVRVLDLTTPADRTAEFQLTPNFEVAADGFINNNGGTSTAAKILLVQYYRRPKGSL